MHARRELLNRIVAEGIAPDEVRALIRELDEGGPEATADLFLKLNAIIDVSNQVAGSLSLDVVLMRMVDTISRALSADRSSIFIHDPGNDELYTRVAQGAELQTIRIPSGAGIAGSAFTSGEPINIPDAYADPRFNQEVDRQTGYRTHNILCAPIRNRAGQIIGVAQVLNKTAGIFTDDDLALLTLMTTQAASALENARLFQQVEQAQREQEQLLALTTAISSELQLKPLLVKIMHQASVMLNADRSTLFMHDAEHDELWSQVAEGLETKTIRFPAHLGIAGSVFTTGDTINIPDAYADSRFNQDVDKQTGYKTETILCMPITTREGKRLGVIQVLNKAGGPFTSDDERRLQAFAAQVSVALENAMLFDQVLEMRNFNESILQSLSNGVVTIDKQRRLTKVNDAAARMLRVDGAWSVGDPLESVLGPDAGWVSSSIASVEGTGATDLTLDRDLPLRDGGAISVNLSTVPQLSAKNDLIGTMLVIEDITSEKRMMGTLSRYMSKEVASKLLSSSDDALGGSVQRATVLFSDIRSFTTISERLGAQETVSMLNSYFSVMVEILFRHGGVLDKYIGDAIMAVFGTPFQGPQDADNAVQAGIEMLRALEEFNAERLAEGKDAINIGIGLNTDEILSGNIGSTKRMDYTVIGDGVNLASRLEGATKQYGAKLLISEFTYTQLTGRYVTRKVDQIRVKGKLKPVGVYEVLDYVTPGEMTKLTDAIARYDRGLEQYRAREWTTALHSFNMALEAYPDDGPSQVYANRCRYFLENPPPAEWDGVWIMTDK